MFNKNNNFASAVESFKELDGVSGRASIAKALKDNGKCYISMPLQRSMTQKFIEYCNENGLKVNGECFNDFGDLFIRVN